MKRKFELVGSFYPNDLNLTKAKQIVGRKNAERLIPGHSIEFRGIGNPTYFTLKRIV